jgi:hypothetical protein
LTSITTTNSVRAKTVKKFARKKNGSKV